MKKILLSVALLMAIIPISVFAEWNAADFPGVVSETASVTASGECGSNVEWIFFDDGTLILTGNGEMKGDYFIDPKYDLQTPWFEYNNLINNIDIVGDISGITLGAFFETSFYKNAVYEDGLFYIGEYLIDAIDDVPKILNIKDGTRHIADSALFQTENENNLKLISVHIPDSVVSIGAGAFACCDNLQYVYIGSGVTKIGDVAFAHCEALKKIEVSENNTCYSSDTYGVLFNKDKSVLIHFPFNIDTDFDKHYNVPETVTEILDHAFVKYSWEYNNNVKCISIGNNVKKMSVHAFGNSTSLSDVYDYHGKTFYLIVEKDSVAENVALAWDLPYIYSDENILLERNCGKYISAVYTDKNRLLIYGVGDMSVINDTGKGWASYASNIKTVIFSSGIDSISEHTFNGFTALECIILSDVNDIKCSLEDCVNLSKIVVNEDNMFYHVRNDVLYKSGITSALCFYPMTKTDEEFTLSHYCELTNSCFIRNRYLKRVNLHDKIYEIPERAFYGCTALEEISIPDSVRSIDDLAFGNCSSLERIYIPDSVVSIGKNIFESCDNLIVYCSESSVMYAYAKQYGYNVEISNERIDFNEMVEAENTLKLPENESLENTNDDIDINEKNEALEHSSDCNKNSTVLGIVICALFIVVLLGIIILLAVKLKNSNKSSD